MQSVTAIDQITGKTILFYFFTLSGKRVHIFTTIVSLGTYSTTATAENKVTSIFCI
jgi:hypothetical protein